MTKNSDSEPSGPYLAATSSAFVRSETFGVTHNNHTETEDPATDHSEKGLPEQFPRGPKLLFCHECPARDSNPEPTD